MGIFEGFFGPTSEIKDKQDLTEDAAKILASKGIVDPRVYDRNIKFLGAANPPEDLKYAHAFVNKTEPGIVNLVKSSWKNLWDNPLNSHTLAHEVEHSLAHTGGKGLDERRARGHVLMDNYASLKGYGKRDDGKFDENYYKPLLDFIDNAKNRKIGTHLKKHYGVDTGYLGASGAENMFVRPSEYEELAADLGSAMKHGKKDVFADPFLQKNLFNNDPYLMEAVRSTLHIEPRMDAKDLQRLTPYPQNIDRFKKMLKYAQGGYIETAGNKKLI